MSSTEKPSEKPSEQSSEIPSEQSSEKPSEQSSENPNKSNQNVTGWVCPGSSKWKGPQIIKRNKENQNIQCLSLDGSQCLTKFTKKECNQFQTNTHPKQNEITIIECGAEREEKKGSSGYTDKSHFCSKGNASLSFSYPYQKIDVYQSNVIQGMKATYSVLGRYNNTNKSFNNITKTKIYGNVNSKQTPTYTIDCTESGGIEYIKTAQYTDSNKLRNFVYIDEYKCVNNENPTVPTPYTPTFNTLNLTSFLDKF